MFSACCSDAVQLRQSPLANHQNPIYHKLGTRKTSRRHKKESLQIVAPTNNPSFFIKEFQMEMQNARKPSQQLSTYTQSIGMPFSEQIKHLHTNCNQVFMYSSLNKKVGDSQIKETDSGSVSARYNLLQEKYIGILERTNNYLQKQLSKSKSSQNLIGSYSCEKKMNSALLLLKDKLNKIDLSGISKLAKIQLKKDSYKASTGKENSPIPLFKKLRQRL